jgi:hypothetical protein
MRKLEALLMADTIDAVLTKLEAFGDRFEYVATTAEQRKLAGEFRTFVGEVGRTLFSGAGPAFLVPEESSFLKIHGHDSLAGLFAEIRADEAAGKQENAHCYRQDALKELFHGKSEDPVSETTHERDIER